MSRYVRFVDVTCCGPYLVIECSPYERAGKDLIHPSQHPTGMNMVCDTYNRMGMSYEAAMLIRSLPKTPGCKYGHIDWWRSNDKAPQWYFEWEGQQPNRIMDTRKMKVGERFFTGAYTTIPNVVPESALVKIRAKG